MSPPSRGWLIFAVVAVAAAATDLATKEAVFHALGMPGERQPIELVEGMLAIETNLNEGALFGMGQGMGAVFATVSVVALAGILAMIARPATRRDPWLVAALALISGGIVGNLYDRLGLPGLRWHAPLERVGGPVRAVRDWIHFVIPGVIDWPIFNLADSCLVIGAGMLLVASLRPAADGFATPAGESPQA
jgi:signal peptidase II